MAIFFDYEILSAQIQLEAMPNLEVPAWVQQQIGNQDLCHRCRAVFQYDLSDNTKWMPDTVKDRLRHRTLAPLSTPVLSEMCTLCCFIWRCLDSSSQKSIRTIEDSLARVDPIPDMTIDFQLDGENIDIVTWVFSVGMKAVVSHFRVQKCSSNMQTRRNDLPEEPLVHVLDEGPALKWLNNCLQLHDHCNQQLRGPTELPTRLIQVRSGDPVRVRLYHTSKNDRDLRYLTLSHCWGKGPPMQLLCDNLSILSNSIDIQSLPKTFRDAVTSTLRLGFSFIWIDALCIIQDDKSDWEVEASRMSTVYSNAALNLAATTATDDHCGFQIQQHAAPRCNLRVLCHGSSIPFVAFSHFIWHNEVTGSPLNKRAWVCQERLLSSRVLHFGKSQLYWECAQSILCESFPVSAAEKMYRSGLKQNFCHVLRSCSTSTPIMAYNLWWTIIENYSDCSLTYTADKLVAISAVASRLHSKIGGRYVAGLWTKFLVPELLWCRAGGAVRPYKPRIRPYVAPTWSWASVEGQVFGWGNESDDYQSLIDVIEVEIELTGNNVFGGIQNAILSIAGGMARGFLRYQPNDLLNKEGCPHPSEYGLISSEGMCLFNGNDDDMFSLWPLDIAPYDESHTHLGDTASFDVDVFFLPLAHFNANDGTIDGLVLRPAKGAIEGHFERLGIFKISKDMVRLFENTRRYFLESNFGKAIRFYNTEREEKVKILLV